MPRLVRPGCAEPACSRPVTWKGRCARHQRPASPNRSFYRTPEWRKLRAAHLTRSPYCLQCGKLADTVDHIQPIAAGGFALEDTNLQSLCSSCHSTKTRSTQTGHSAHTLRETTHAVSEMEHHDH